MIARPSPVDFTGRDLRFRPADPTRATTLHPSQVARFNEHGHLGGIEVLDPARLRTLRGAVDDLLATVAGPGGAGSYAINGYHRTCASLWDVVQEPRIVAVVADVLGPEIVCWGTHLFAKMPGDGKVVPFHQDAVYWPFEPSHTVTVWLAIDDVDAANAAVQFVPGSHLAGPLEHVDVADDGTRVLPRTVRDLGPWTARVSNDLPAGFASLHSDLLLHGSDANTSTRRRAGLTLRYAAAHVRVPPAFDEWRRNAVHVLAGDPSHWWPHLDRPPGEDPGAMSTRASTAVDAG